MAELPMTPEQVFALERKHEQADNGMTLSEFCAAARPTFGMDGAIVVPWCGMWLVIERDGYTHT